MEEEEEEEEREKRRRRRRRKEEEEKEEKKKEKKEEEEEKEKKEEEEKKKEEEEKEKKKKKKKEEEPPATENITRHCSTLCILPPGIHVSVTWGSSIFVCLCVRYAWSLAIFFLSSDYFSAPIKHCLFFFFVQNGMW